MDSSLFFRTTLAGVLSALLVWLVIWLTQYLDATLFTPQLSFMADSLRLADGSGSGTSDGLSVPPPSSGQPTLVKIAMSGFFAQDFSQLSWDISALPEHVVLAVTWYGSASPGKGQIRVVSVAERAAGSMNLAFEPSWQGEIRQLGILLIGTWVAPVLVKQLSLRREASSPLAVLAGFWRDWTLSEPWTPRSINFYIGAQPGQRLTPVTTMALWVASGLLVFVLLNRPITVGHLASGFALLALTAWFLLDARWQWQLGERLLATYETFGHLPAMQRAAAAPDGKIHAAVARIREQLPGDHVRIFIIHQESSSYFLGRIRFHLLPYPSYGGLSHLPTPAQVRRGDHVLVLANVTDVRFDRQGKKLLDNVSSLLVEPKMAIPGFGTLYRVEAGP